MPPIQQIKVSSPLGQLVVVSDNDQITQLLLDPDKKRGYQYGENEISNLPDCLIQAKKQLEEYFRGERKSFSLPLFISVTGCQKKILEKLQELPFGKTISYGELSLQVGIQKGARVIGKVMAKNLLPILIPCHRVIRADGNLGGYSLGGSQNKQVLLRLEGLGELKRKK